MATESTGHLFSVEGKVVVVTGGSRGIGAMIASGLLRAGAKKVYLCSRKADELAHAAEEMSAIGEVDAFASDLGTAEGVAAFAGHVAESEEAVHVLFNNAGANWGATLEEFPESGWDKVLDVNLKGVFLLTQALLPQLSAAAEPGDPARVVNVGSIDGIRVPVKGFNNFSYAASKAGVHMLTRQLAGELAPNVLVNAIAPGLFETKMTAAILSGGADAVVEQMPLGRIGAPDDIAGISIFLASRASAYITGAVIPVDGGVSNG
jgi:NAD(P)-dependent dehydrogenase (short-subunit alcohol dehydrogenase family)